MGNSADKLRMPRICCLFSCWISSRSRHAELVCTITQQCFNQPVGYIIQQNSTLNKQSQ